MKFSVNGQLNALELIMLFKGICAVREKLLSVVMVELVELSPLPYWFPTSWDLVVKLPMHFLII